MQTSFTHAAAFTLLGAETSALSLRRDDGGNWTGGEVGVGALIGSKYGVSAPQLTEYLGRTAMAADMKAVTQAIATAIFGANFWNRINADQLPAGADLMTADHGYNRGASTGARVLQRLVGTDADGWIGPGTLESIAAFTAEAIPLAVVDAKALQEGAGVTQDGVIGPTTRAALAALSATDILLVGLYAAQVHDYRSLAAAPANPGWFTRARSRLAAGRVLTA